MSNFRMRPRRRRYAGSCESTKEQTIGCANYFSGNNGEMQNPLRERVAARGARFSEEDGFWRVEDFGDANAEYQALRTETGVVPRTDIAPVRLWGRDPVRMVQGLITNDLANAPAGQSVYAAMLTPKGRIISDLRALRLPAADSPEVFLLVPRQALEAVSNHLRKFVPPLFARWEDASAATGVIGVYGPGANEVLDAVLGFAFAEAQDGAVATAQFQGLAISVIRSDDAGGEAGFDVVAPADALAPLWDLLVAPERTRPVGLAALEVWRIEGGRPRAGSEITEEMIATEAFESTGLVPRAISFSKGCYTGQEVIIRIAHRGHVNRLLRGLRLGDQDPPASGTRIFHPETGKDIGWVTSTTRSPLAGETIALAYIRRGVDPGAEVRLAAADGASARVSGLPFTASAG